METSQQECAYCGDAATAQDHIPPRTLYGDWPQRATDLDLITVPSCDPCNTGEQLDDEHFAHALLVLAASKGADIAEDVSAPIFRAFARSRTENRRAPIAGLIAETRSTWDVPAGSALVQPVQKTPIEWRRLTKTVERIARGLYWKHHGERVPSTHDVLVIGDRERARLNSSTAVRIFQDLAGVALAGYRHQSHQPVFAYGIEFDPTETDAAAMLLIFHVSVVFVAVVGPRSDERAAGLWLP